VVKLGGSLLARAGWPTALAALLPEFRQGALLVVGGGMIVDGLRHLDAVTRLPQEVSHGLAIEALGITARAVAAATGLPLTVAACDPAPAPGRSAVAVLDTPRWLARAGTTRTADEATGDPGDDDPTGSPPATRRAELRPAPLPCGWHVTSDSIAAFVAAALARPLVLVKSLPPPADAADLAALAAAGWVDPFFPQAAASLGEISWAAPVGA